jgi:cellulose biosynthesis protein BcsQ
MPPLRVISVASNKGGVGKTTLATNLAVYVRALREELPILVLGLDDQDLIERMFALGDSAPAAPNVLEALRARELRPAIRLGQYGVHYIPPSPTISNLESGLSGPFMLRDLLIETGWNGLVVIDTKSDLGSLTQNALAASDLSLIAVADQTSLDQAERIYRLLDGWGLPRERARIVLSLIDRRVKYHSGEDTDILALLLSEIRRREYPFFESFVSRSPKIESLSTNPERRAHSILHGAHGSLIHRQMTHLATDVLRLLEAKAAAPTADRAAARSEDRRRQPRRPFVRRIACFSLGVPPIIALSARDLSLEGIAVEASPELARAGRVHLALASEGAGDSLLVWARLVRSDGESMALCFDLADDAALRRRLAGFVAGLEPQPSILPQARAPA